MRWIAVLWLSSLVMAAQTGSTMRTARSASDTGADMDPKSQFWRSAPVTAMTKDNYGQPVSGHTTEIRSRWTDGYLYLLFTCPYERLWLKSEPVTTSETNKLWDWDVAEVFIGSDPNRIRRYKEFELSPQGEWVDLDIGFDPKDRGEGIGWDSHFQTSARIDSAAKTWYAFMKIPWKAIDTRPATVGNELRINLFRQQGPPPKRVQLCWQPTGQESFHAPEKFGTLKLVEGGTPAR